MNNFRLVISAAKQELTALMEGSQNEAVSNLNNTNVQKNLFWVHCATRLFVQETERT